MEEQDWRMMQLLNSSGWPWRRTKKKSKTGEDGSYNRLRLLAMEKMVATEQLGLAMETDKERKARLEKMVTNTQLKLALIKGVIINKLIRTIIFFSNICMYVYKYGVV